MRRRLITCRWVRCGIGIATYTSVFGAGSRRVPPLPQDAVVGSGGLAVLAENRCAPGLHRGAELTLARVPIKVRFAPSPTRSLHLGNALSAVINRRLGDWMLLRIDDTDPARNVEGGEAAILRDLEWLGIGWDDGPVRQSERAERHREAAAVLGDRFDGVTLLREDGSPTYQLATVVDDVDFGIMHIVRG